jgi:hypothetical protein
MRAVVLVPAYQVAPVVGEVVAELRALWDDPDAIWVLDDGSSDGTGEVAAAAGARVLRHPRNRGKGAALRTGLEAARAAGFEVAVTVDGDGQHPPSEALRLHRSCADPGALVLGVRDLGAAGAPRPNQLSNRFSNWVLSGFVGRRLSDTQCGLRRYPVAATLALGGLEDGYGYEAEVLLRATATAMPIVEVPIRVLYPPEGERITHFHSVRDPARIVRRVLATMVVTRGPRLLERARRRRWLRRALLVVAALLLTVVLVHGGVILATAMTPPAVTLPAALPRTAADDPGRREIGEAYARKRGSIHEVRLVGDPVTVGAAHVRLLYDEQVAIEKELHDQFAHYVPLLPARWLIVDLARLRFRHLDEVLGDDYRLELAAQAAAFEPDPFSSLMNTYQRFVFLHSLYDIMLSFERSPLVACTSFVVRGEGTAHTLVGRNFDFEGPAALDQRKAVFLMREDGHLPYATVSWPGFVGTASGMNGEGLAVVIHGARAGEPSTAGEPVAQTVRALLRQARTSDEAVALLADREPMVSHMLLIADAAGKTLVAERVPGQPLHLRPADGPTLALTNHLEGPLASDPRNLEVERLTSTLPRRKRLDELLAGLVRPATVADVVAVLRDKRALGGVELPLGHRSAIDGLIATHSVVMDTTGRELWVSEGPHASGRYVRFALTELLASGYRPEGPAPVETLPGDDIAEDGRYEGWVGAGSPHPGAE